MTVTRIPSFVLRNTWHYVIIRRRKFRFPKFVLRCSYEAASRKGVTTALLENVFMYVNAFCLFVYCIVFNMSIAYFVHNALYCACSIIHTYQAMNEDK